MPLINAIPLDLNDSVFDGDIECECMACHLPLDEEHGPVRWKLTWYFPGPYPLPGTETMLLCTPCYEDWIENPDELGGMPESSHPV